MLCNNQGMGFKKLFRKSLGFVLKPLEVLPEPLQQIAYPVVGAAIGSTVGMPQLGAVLGSAANAYNDSGSLRNAALAAGGTYAGQQLGGAIGAKLGAGTVGQYAGNTFGSLAPNVSSSSIGNFVGNNFGSSAGNLASNLVGQVANTSLGSAVGSQLGSNIAQNYFDQPGGNSGYIGFQPRQEQQKDTPASIQGLGGLTSEQQSTNIANQGVYGGGAGPQEQRYFLNLVNRRLIDEGNHQADISTLRPIESSYLQNLGLGGYGNTSNLLEAINRWQPQAT